MDRLGYDRYGVQGGDIGAAVSPEVGRVGAGPGRRRARQRRARTDAAAAAVGRGAGDADPLEQDRVARVEAFMQEEFGYIAIQSTRPQTLAYGLVDSPVGQLAWIMDKFREWTHPRATLPDEIIDRDRLLTNVMIYWLTGTAGSAGVRRLRARSTVGRRSRRTPACRPAAIVFAHDVGIRRYAEAGEHDRPLDRRRPRRPLRRPGGAGAADRRRPRVLPRPALTAGPPSHQTPRQRAGSRSAAAPGAGL